MDIEQLRSICLKLNGVTEDIKWGEHLTFCVGNKIFIIIGMDIVPTSASFKTNTEDFEDLLENDGFKAAPYLARGNWIHVNDINLLTENQWKKYIHKSYDIIKSKLSKKMQEALK